jgi:hypothetical protein
VSVTRARTAGIAVALGVVLSSAACSGSGTSSATHAHAAAPTNAAATATRWWSNSAAQVGSAISAEHPEAVAGHLRPSRADYCLMLRQTTASRHSIMPGVAGGTALLLTTTTAFVSELQHVAPAAVTEPWRTLGSAVLLLVASDGKASGTTKVDAAAVQRASTLIATDAKHSCGVDLSVRPSG